MNELLIMPKLELILLISIGVMTWIAIGKIKVLDKEGQIALIPVVFFLEMTALALLNLAYK